jgi:hypothetical protein
MRIADNYVHRAERAGEAVARFLVWGGLAVCVLGSVAYDIWTIQW